MTAEAVARRAVQDHERRSGRQVRVSTRAVPDPVPLPVKIALFRALQESLSNAMRHGESEEVEVELTGTPEGGQTDASGLNLLVRDHGTGFDPATLGSSDGLGLAGIREQAEVLGGSFSLRSAPGEGTELRVWWPLQDGAVET